jgi:hypothetical protein
VHNDASDSDCPENVSFEYCGGFSGQATANGDLVTFAGDPGKRLFMIAPPGSSRETTFCKPDSVTK